MLVMNGLYRFDADEAEVSVSTAKQQLLRTIKTFELTKGRHASLGTSVLQSQKFDRDQAKGDLYEWSKLRSDYIAAANRPRIALVNRG